MIEELDIPERIINGVKQEFTYKDIVSFIPVISVKPSSLAITINYDDIQDEPLFESAYPHDNALQIYMQGAVDNISHDLENKITTLLSVTLCELSKSVREKLSIIYSETPTIYVPVEYNLPTNDKFVPVSGLLDCIIVSQYSKIIVFYQINKTEAIFDFMLDDFRFTKI